MKGMSEDSRNAVVDALEELWRFVDGQYVQLDMDLCEGVPEDETPHHDAVMGELDSWSCQIRARIEALQGEPQP